MFQLHLNNENRTEHTFKTKEQALQHQELLIQYSMDRLGEGRLAFKSYLKDAKELKIVEVERPDKRHVFSVCENKGKYSGIVKHFYERKYAEQFLVRLQEDSERIYTIMESLVNS